MPPLSRREVQGNTNAGDFKHLIKKLMSEDPIIVIESLRIIYGIVTSLSSSFCSLLMDNEIAVELPEGLLTIINGSVSEEVVLIALNCVSSLIVSSPILFAGYIDVCLLIVRTHTDTSHLVISLPFCARSCT